jgi:hypothetical protein
VRGEEDSLPFFPLHRRQRRRATSHSISKTFHFLRPTESGCCCCRGSRARERETQHLLPMEEDNLLCTMYARAPGAIGKDGGGWVRRERTSQPFLSPQGNIFRKKLVQNFLLALAFPPPPLAASYGCSLLLSEFMNKEAKKALSQYLMGRPAVMAF